MTVGRRSNPAAGIPESFSSPDMRLWRGLLVWLTVAMGDRRSRWALVDLSASYASRVFRFLALIELGLVTM